jgi:hypothetical protein
MGKQDLAIADGDYVLKNLDAKNAKALFRRGFGMKSKGNFEEAARDF